MKIFIDINHPAHVHYFKNIIKRLQNKGHSFVITARDKEMAHDLLNNLNYEFYSRGKGAEGFIKRIVYTIKADLQLYKLALKEKPDLFLSYSSPYCAHTSSLVGKPHIAFDDTENATFMRMLYKPFSDIVLTPKCFRKDLGSQQIRFTSYMELSYLHPKIFQPNKSIYNYLGIEIGKPYVIIRFVAWRATHDIGHKGISLENKMNAVRTFSEWAHIFISSEAELPDELKKYKLNIPKHMIHDALAFSSMYYGESATMASESAILGVPAIYIDNVGRGYTHEQESKYGLVFNFTESKADQLESIKKGVEILQIPKSNWEAKREKLLRENIDLTPFIEYFIENYPESIEVMKKNPGYQERFKMCEPRYVVR